MDSTELFSSNSTLFLSASLPDVDSLNNPLGVLAGSEDSRLSNEEKCPVRDGSFSEPLFEENYCNCEGRENKLILSSREIESSRGSVLTGNTPRKWPGDFLSL